MQANISARGYSSVILVMNMKRFVSGEEERKKFETLRGKPALRDVLRSNWLEAAAGQNIFLPMSEYKQRQFAKDGREFLASDKMSTEEIGFATGIFRSLMLEEYATPTYAVDKSNISFPQALETNFQFKTLFKRAWDRWDIFIRPTITGFFIIRLTEHYHDRPRSFLSLAQDVLRLQESIDVPSAQRWLEHSREKYAGSPEMLQEKERSVHALLDWVGAKDQKPNEIMYYPIQWKIAMEIASRFVASIGSCIPLKKMDEGKPESEKISEIRLEAPQASLSIPLHDSYVIHHFDEVLASPAVIKGAKDNGAAQISATLNDIRGSNLLRRAFINLTEGSVLRPGMSQENASENKEQDAASTQALEKMSYFPNPRWSLVDDLLKENQSSWNDEFCMLTSRTAIILPSREWRDFEMSVSTVPSATLRVKYARYWGAIERMIEFVVEIRVLAQLVESESFSLLNEIAHTVDETRSKLFSGDIKIDSRLPNLVTRAAYLRSLAALSQSLSHPQLWSRAEYAGNKANHLFRELGVPTILQHIERNITSINSVVDHVDELYMADLSEKSNDVSTLLSIGLASASLTLTVLMLPSFWADMLQSFEAAPQGLFTTIGFWMIFLLGNVIAAILIALAITLLRPAYSRRDQVLQIIKKLMNGRK